MAIGSIWLVLVVSRREGARSDENTRIRCVSDEDFFVFSSRNLLIVGDEPADLWAGS